MKEKKTFMSLRNEYMRIEKKRLCVFIYLVWLLLFVCAQNKQLSSIFAFRKKQKIALLAC